MGFWNFLKWGKLLTFVAPNILSNWGFGISIYLGYVSFRPSVSFRLPHTPTPSASDPQSPWSRSKPLKYKNLKAFPGVGWGLVAY